MGFVAIDLSKALALPLFDPNNKNARIADDAYPKAGNGVIGNDPAKPDVVVATNGGSDLIYIPKQRPRAHRPRSSRRCWHRITSAACLWMTSSGIFRARCRLSSIGLKGKAITPHPSIVVNFRSMDERLRRSDGLLG